MDPDLRRRRALHAGAPAGDRGPARRRRRGTTPTPSAAASTSSASVIRFSGWQHDQVVRLVRHGTARYPNRRVHADMITRGPAPLLKNPMEHYMTDALDEYARRIEKYSFWGAAQNWRERQARRARWRSSGARSWRFLRTYVFQLGVLDGMHGLVFCMLQALRHLSQVGAPLGLARQRRPRHPAATCPSSTTTRRPGAAWKRATAASE